MASGPIGSWQIDGETMERVTDIFFLGSKITANGDCSHEFKRYLLLGRKAMNNLDSILKSRDFTLPIMVCIVKAGFSGSYVQMWELNHKEGWVPKNWCFSTVVLEKICESPLDSKNIQSVNPKGNESWIFIGRTDDEAPKDPDARKGWRQEKGTTEDEMVGWHHRFNGHEFEQSLGDGEGQGSLACYSPWGHKGLDLT